LTGNTIQRAISLEGMNETLEKLEKLIGYKFHDLRLLERALTHSSAANEGVSEVASDNEQLEFLGDSILGFLISDFLFHKFGHLSEGELSKIRAHLVSSPSLFRIAAQLELGEFLILGKGEEKSGGRKKQALQVDALEAVVAAIYMDGGIAPAWEFASRCFRPDFDAIEKGSFDLRDFKSQLQEKLQAVHLPAAEYHVVRESGPDHRKYFSVELRVQGKRLAEGHGETKKSAEQEAARLALDLVLDVTH
jgi:ribonuclease-3